MGSRNFQIIKISKLDIIQFKQTKISMQKIAAILTCYNRKEKTIKCLNALYDCYLPINYTLDVFLVDDGSTDGTSDAIRSSFPGVNVFLGNGKLFWNQGMRLAWEKAAQVFDFDFYLWLNDDAILEKNALYELFDIQDRKSVV